MPKVIVLDPGHGGWDSGARAVDGRLEKAFTLELALAVREQLLRGWQCEVLMTRDGDVGLAAPGDQAGELKARAAVANQAKADLLVSLHHDSTGDSGVRGASLWIWTKELGPGRKLTWGPAAGRHTDPKTYPPAQTVVGPVREAIAQLGVPWRWWNDPEGIAAANFGVLSSTRGPALLIECYHGSNAQDVAAARAPGFIPQLAGAIAGAVATALGLPATWSLPTVKVILPGGQEVWGEASDGATNVILPGMTEAVPIRPVAEALGHQVTWIQDPPTVKVK